MEKIWNWIKSSWLLLIICIISVVMVYQYRKTFSGGMSTDSSDWGNFGSYLGAITGLLAFAGAIYAIMNSNKQARLAEERGSFFKMLDLYQKQVDSAVYINKKGAAAFLCVGGYIYNKMNMYIIYNEIINDEKFTEEEPELFDRIMMNYRKGGYKKLKNITFKSHIEFDVSHKKIIVPYDFGSKEDPDYYPQFSTYIIKTYKENKEYYFKYVYNTMRNVADSVYIDCGYFLGQYYRNVYYLLVMISESSEDEKYSKIFTAQLSRYELVSLLYNAVSSQSSIEIVTLLRRYNIFNNIIAEDIF
jgi:hypothetical protein